MVEFSGTLFSLINYNLDIKTFVAVGLIGKRHEKINVTYFVIISLIVEEHVVVMLLTYIFLWQ